MRKIERIIDVNQNRSVEGLRVLEEYCRFIKEDKTLASQIRGLRHKIRKKLGQRWTIHRDSDGDIGKAISKASTLDSKKVLVTNTKS